MDRFEQYRLIKQYKADGLSQRKTSEVIGINRATVNKYWDMSDAEYDGSLNPSEKLLKHKYLIKQAVETGSSARDIADELLRQYGETYNIRTVSRFINSEVASLSLPNALVNDRFQYNSRNVGDGLELLCDIKNKSISSCFFDAQYLGLLDEMRYGNQERQVGRLALPQMNTETIHSFVLEIDRVLKHSGYLFAWVDKYHLCKGIDDWIANTSLHIVDMITWEKERFGMGYRTRRKSEYLLILQKEPLKAKDTWVDHSIPDVWKEGAGNTHPHCKPIQLQKRLILATTNPGDIVLDPCAGSFSVLEACRLAERDFIGTDLLPVTN